MDDWRDKIVFYDGEDPEALRQEFIRTSAHHLAFGRQYPPQLIAQHIFRNLREPSRFLQAAQVWAADLEVIAAIDDAAKVKACGETLDVSKEAMQRLLLTIANDPMTEAKVKVLAIAKIMESEGQIVKAVNVKATGEGGNNADVVKQLAALLPR